LAAICRQIPLSAASSSSIVPLLQVLVELAVLRADEPAAVFVVVSCMSVATAGSVRPGLGLQAAQAAGLLGPVLHLLSAAVFRVLSPPAQGLASAVDCLSAEQHTALSTHFCGMVPAVVLPGALSGVAAGCSSLFLRCVDCCPGRDCFRSLSRLPCACPCVLQLSHGTCLKCSRAHRSIPEAVIAVEAALLHIISSSRAAGAQSGSVSSRAAPWISYSGSHWLSLSGRCVVVFSEMKMVAVGNAVLAGTVGVRAGLGLREGEVTLASAAEAVIRAAGSAAAAATSNASDTRPAGEAGPAAAQQEQVAAAATAGGGMGLLMLCAPSESNLELLVRGSAATVAPVTGYSFVGKVLRYLGTGLKQLAKQQQQQQTCGIAPEQLQQLAQAALDVQQPLDEWCNDALLAAFKHYQQPQQQLAPEDVLQCFTQTIQHNTDGINDSQGHALLAVLHHLQRLQQLGAAVCAALPPPSLACANPGCDNVSRLSKMQLVWRRGV
jgi:hypothetical protein